MMTLKIEKETRLGPQYKIEYDYNNPHERRLHYLMMGVEAMLNSVQPGPITKAEIQYYDAYIPEFIPECCLQGIRFEMVYTPRSGGNHVNVSVACPKTLTPVSGTVSPSDFIEYCKYRALVKLLFDEYDEYLTIPYKNSKYVFDQCRDWIYTKFGHNARNKIWPNFENEVAKEVRKKYSTKEAFEKYAEESARQRLRDDSVSPDCAEYYTNTLQFWYKTFVKGIDKYYN